MALVGNIRDFGLSDFLYLVDRGYKTGCLHLGRAYHTPSLYFDKGKLVTAARKNSSAPVVQLLQLKGKLTAQQAQHAIQVQHSDGSVSLVQVLMQLEYVSHEDLQ